MIKRGQVWFAELGTPRGSSPGYQRPVVVVQADKFNKTNLDSVIVAVSTTNMRLARMPGNILLERGVAGMRENSVVNVTQLFTLDRSDLLELWGRLPNDKLERLNEGLAQVIGLE